MAAACRAAEGVRYMLTMQAIDVVDIIVNTAMHADCMYKVYVLLIVPGM